jgi:hypothetical protein
MKDLRCLDAHVLLGTWEQSLSPRVALSHFEVAMAIVDYSLGDDFDGVIPWEGRGSMTVLVVLDAYAHCLWQLGRVDEAKAVFERLLWLNPADPAEAQTALLDLRAGTRWEDRRHTEFAP